MFGRRPRGGAQGTPRSDVDTRTHVEALLVADPDYRTIDRDRELRDVIGRSLQGQAGIVIDYDRGDPEHSYTRVVQPFMDPTGSINRIGMADGIHLAQSEIYDIGTSDEELTAYQAAMLARISR